MGVEIELLAEPLALRARAIWAVEGKGRRVYLRVAHPTLDARELLVEKKLLSAHDLYFHEAAGETGRCLERVCETPQYALFYDEPVYDYIYVVLLALVEDKDLFEVNCLAVYPGAGVPVLAQRLELFFIFALPAPDDRREERRFSYPVRAPSPCRPSAVWSGTQMSLPQL